MTQRKTITELKEWAIFDADMIAKAIDEVLHTPYATSIRLKFEADLESIPTLSYSVSRVIMKVGEDN